VGDSIRSLESRRQNASPLWNQVSAPRDRLLPNFCLDLIRFFAPKSEPCLALSEVAYLTTQTNPNHRKDAYMRNAGRLKLGYYPLPTEEARNLRQFLIAPQSFFAVDPCAGDGTALVELTRGLPAQHAAIELDADRAAAAAARGIATTHGSTFESHLPAGSCSLLYLNPPYDVEIGRYNNQRLELVFLDYCYGWLKTAGVLVFLIPEMALSHCAKRLASQFERISVFRLGHPESVRFHQLAVMVSANPNTNGATRGPSISGRRSSSESARSVKRSSATL